MTAPVGRDPFEVMSEATNRATGWGIIAAASFLLSSLVGAIGAAGDESVRLVVGLVAAGIGSLFIPAAVLAVRELMRRGRANDAIRGGVR